MTRDRIVMIKRAVPKRVSYQMEERFLRDTNKQQEMIYLQM